MLDLKFIRDNLDLVRENIVFRGVKNADVPKGGEGDARVMQTIGTPRTFEFEPRDHLAIGTALKLIDFESASGVSGQKFYYLMNEGALLELALINFAMSKLVAKGFTP